MPRPSPSWPAVLAAFLAASACETPGRVDESYLVEASDAEREKIAEARAGHALLQDDLAYAQRDLDRERAVLKTAKKELEVARQEIDEADKRVKAAEKSGSGDLEPAREQHGIALAHRGWAREVVAYHEARVDWARAKHELARTKVLLAEAEVELEKAEALEDVPEAGVEPDVHRDEVDQARVRVALAEIDARAGEQRVEVYRRSVDDKAAAVPADHRATWSTPSLEEGAAEEGDGPEKKAAASR